MKQLLQLTWTNYGVAVLLTASALLLTQQTPFRDGSPYLLFILAIMLSARYGGLGPGLLACLLAVVAIKYLFIPPFYSFWVEKPDDLGRLGVFALIAIVLSWFMAAHEKSKQLARILAQRRSIIAKLAEHILIAKDVPDLLNEISPLLCDSFDVEYAGIMQIVPDGNSLLLKAGCGWPDGVVGQLLIGTDTESSDVNWLLSKEPLVFYPSDKGRDIKVPKFLAEYNVCSGMSVIIQGDAHPFGAMVVYTPKQRHFSEDDVSFVQTFAGLVSKAIERIQTETRVREKSNWLQMTLSSIADGVIAVDSQGVVTLINSVGQSLTGWSQAESISQRLDDIFKIIDEKSDKPIENPATQAIRTSTVSKLESHGVLMTKGGKQISIDANAAPMRDDIGRLIGAVLIFRDTTVPRQIEEAIRQSEERLRVALKNSPVVVFNQDIDLRYTWVHNPMHGFPHQSVLGKTDADLMPQVDSGRWTEIKRGVIESGLGTRVELSATIDGQRRTFDLTVEPLRDHEDKIVGVTCASIDITERKREQATISRLAAIVESSEDAVVGMTLDGIILSWNPGAERMYGYDPDEIIGQSVSMLYPPDRMDEFRQVTERLRQGEPAKQHDTVRVRKDGGWIDVSVSVSLVRDGMGRVIGASSIARDITQRKRVEESQRFRADISEAISSSLEYKTTFERIAQRAVSRMADWCSVHLLTEDGTLEWVALAHADPAHVEKIHELWRRFPIGLNDSTGVPNVIRTGQPEWVERVTDEHLAAAARDAEHLKLLVEMGLKSYIIVPLTARKRTFGAISFVSAESGRHFTDDDLALLQDLANRAALLVENARLFQELQKANEYLEQRVIQRTIELQGTNKKLQEEIGERQRANEQLRQLSAHLQSAREEERTRVAREIHDELGQVLTVVKMDLSLLERNLSERGKANADDDIVTQIRATSQLVDDSIEKMRQIIRELRPGILDHLGLKSAIEWQAQEFQAHTGIECHFDAGDEEMLLDLDRSTAVFRIFQETLTNIARHSQATRVDIRLEKNDQLTLQVRDNGRGVTENEISNQKSFGILGMRERALVFGGEVDVRGEQGKGTVVSVRIPMEKRGD